MATKAEKKQQKKNVVIGVVIGIAGLMISSKLGLLEKLQEKIEASLVSSKPADDTNPQI